MLEVNPSFRGSPSRAPVCQILLEATQRMTARILSAMLAFAILIAGATPLQALDPPIPSPRLLSLHYELMGESEEALVKEASVRAILSAIGRVYFSDLMLRGRSLLDAYVVKRWMDFAVHEVSLSEVRGGRRFVNLDVLVDCKKLYDDLHEKRFIYRPALRPVFYVFLSETYDGEKTTPVGRRHLLETIQNREYRYLWANDAEDFSVPPSQKQEVAVREPLPDLDVSRTAEDLASACAEAQRNEVEVFIAGTLETKTTRKGKLYFDEYTFVETFCSLKLIRSDTGEALASDEVRTAAGHVNAADAVAAATRAAVDKIAPGLFDVFDKQWGKTILRKANLRVMVFGADNDSLDLLKQVLTGVSPDLEIYTRSSYADVAVLTLSWKDRTRDLVDVLRQTHYPDLIMAPIEPDGMVVQIF